MAQLGYVSIAGVGCVVPGNREMLIVSCFVLPWLRAESLEIRFA